MPGWFWILIYYRGSLEHTNEWMLPPNGFQQDSISCSNKGELSGRVRIKAGSKDRSGQDSGRNLAEQDRSTWPLADLCWGWVWRERCHPWDILSPQQQGLFSECSAAHCPFFHQDPVPSVPGLCLIWLWGLVGLVLLPAVPCCAQVLWILRNLWGLGRVK